MEVTWDLLMNRYKKEYIMKTTYKHILIGLLAGGAVMMAGTVTIPNKFTPNTTAKAAEVNANFKAVKDAVNDNADKISTNANNIAANEAAIQANETAIGKKVSEVKVARGLMVDRADGNVTIKLPDGYVAVHGSAFNVSDEVGSDCMLLKDKNGAYFFPGGAAMDGCKAYATITLPPYSTVDKMQCRVKHADSTADTVVNLYEQYTFRQITGFTTSRKNDTLLTITFDAPASSDFQVESATYTPPTNYVLGTYGYSSYIIEWAPSKTSNAGNNEILYDCAVYYKY
jgi:hypothetical protein